MRAAKERGRTAEVEFLFATATPRVRRRLPGSPSPRRRRAASGRPAPTGSCCRASTRWRRPASPVVTSPTASRITGRTCSAPGARNDAVRAHRDGVAAGARRDHASRKPPSRPERTTATFRPPSRARTIWCAPAKPETPTRDAGRDPGRERRRQLHRHRSCCPGRGRRADPRPREENREQHAEEDGDHSRSGEEARHEDRVRPRRPSSSRGPP